MLRVQHPRSARQRHDHLQRDPGHREESRRDGKPHRRLPGLDQRQLRLRPPDERHCRLLGRQWLRSARQRHHLGRPESSPGAGQERQRSGALAGVVQVSTGIFNTCARLSNGGIDCWGHNGDYQLGDGTNVDHLVPHAVLNGAGHGPIVGQTGVSVGQYNVCSTQSDGSARCWGLNQFGVLGVGAGVPFAPLPVRVKAVSGSGFLANVTSISAAPNHTCALLKNGTADCWGANTFGQLGDGTTTTRLRPIPVRNVLGTATLVHIAQITTGGGSSGGDHTCVRLLAKTALCWGGNTFGQLGDGTKVTRHRPVIVKAPSGIGSLANVTSIVAGPIDTCAMLTSGGARCWGFNQAGQFGNGQAFNRTRPTPAAP